MRELRGMPGDPAKARSLVETHTAAIPVAKLGQKIFGDEGDEVGASDQFELVRIGGGSNEDEIGSPVGR